MAEPVGQDDSAVLGVTPSASAALASKRALASATLDSSRALFRGLITGSFVTTADLSRSEVAIERLDSLLAVTDRPGQAVEPVFYEWYFRAIDFLKQKQFAALATHARKVAAVSAMPLIRAGALEEGRAEPLELDVPEDGQLCLSEREQPLHIQSLIGHSTAVLVTRNSNLYIFAGKDARELDWRAVDHYGRFAIPGCPIFFWQSGYALRRIIADYQRDLSRIHQDVHPFRLIAPTEFDNSAYVERFAAGLALIERCWPELYAEVCVLTDYFTMIEGVPFIGGSAISCLGTSFFKLLPDWSDVCFADHIVHEAAHQRLHVEFELQPALTNGDFTAAISPIRRDPRPLHGVLHASFVFLRLAQFMERVVEQENTLDAERRLHRHLLGLYRGLEQLDRHAQWHPRGEQLFSLMCQTADRLRSVVSQPDPERYNRLGPDYEPVNALAAAYHD